MTGMTGKFSDEAQAAIKRDQDSSLGKRIGLTSALQTLIVATQMLRAPICSAFLLRIKVRLEH